MVANPAPSSAPRQSTLAILWPPSRDSPPCQRFALLASAGDKSPPAPALSRTIPPGHTLSPASDPPVGGGSHASANEGACVRRRANCVCRLGSFFSKGIRHFSQFLGHVKAINHRLAVFQHGATSFQERRPHIGVMKAHAQTLLRRQSFQTRLA